MNQAVLLLGSNMGDRLANLSQAKYFLEKNLTSFVSESSVYESEPWGFDDEISFLNQVVVFETIFSPLDLLDVVQKIEKDLGRVRYKNTYESRTIDIDILFYDDLIVDEERLKIPHPQIANRRFTLEPLNELFPQMLHPVLKKSIQDLLNNVADKLWVKKYSGS